MAAAFENVLKDTAISRSARITGDRLGRNFPPGHIRVVKIDKPLRHASVREAAKSRPHDAKSERIAKVLFSLRNGSCDERLAAARELGDIASIKGVKIPEVVIPLTITLSSDSDSTVREEAAWSLWKMGDNRAHRPLIKALIADSSVMVREKAARALGLMGVAAALPVMIDLLALGKHMPARLRAAIAVSLGFFAEEKSLPHLMRATDDVEPAVRAGAIRALGRYLVDSSRDISEKVMRKIERYTKRRYESLPPIRRVAIQALKLSADARANAIVAQVLRSDPDASVREEACEALQLWGSPQSEDALIEALAADDWRVRKAAARSLARQILRFGVHRSSKVCEALGRIERMFPLSSLEQSLAIEAKASL